MREIVTRRLIRQHILPDAIIIFQTYRDAFSECSRKIIQGSMFARKIISINYIDEKLAHECEIANISRLLLPNRRQRGQLHYRLQKTALRAAGRELTFTSGPTLIEFNAPSYNDNLFFCVSRVCVRRRRRTVARNNPRPINIADH